MLPIYNNRGAVMKFNNYENKDNLSNEWIATLTSIIAKCLPTGRMQ